MQIKNGPKRVFITGARGFLGRALTARFQAHGAETRGVDLRADPAAGIIAGDISRPGDWIGALEGVDLLIHSAAIVSMTAKPQAAWAVNVKGTRVLLNAAASAGVPRFVYISSIAAFGWQFPDGVSEDYPLMPNGNTYVDTKIAAEHAVLAAHGSGQIDCTIVRPGDVYGPGSVPWVILPVQMMRKHQFILPNHGRGIFSPVYISDLLDGIVLAACLAPAKGELFTLSGPTPVSCAEFFAHHARWLGRSKVSSAPKWLLDGALEWARIVIQAMGKKTELGKGMMDILARPGGYSIEKARRVLGYEPVTTLEEGMRASEAWARTERLV